MIAAWEQLHAATLRRVRLKTTTEGQSQLEITYAGHKNNLMDQTSVTVVLFIAYGHQQQY